MYMIFWVLQRIIISIVLILCVHYIFIFLKTNLTVPKTRDLVNQPREKYKEIYEQINTNNKMSPSSTDSGSNADNSKMKNELKNYLKELLYGVNYLAIRFTKHLSSRQNMNAANDNPLGKNNPEKKVSKNA